MTTVAMSNAGRLTVPAEIRRELGIVGSAEFEVEVDRDNGVLMLKPREAQSEADAWAYTPEHRVRLARAHEDSRQGRVQKLTEEELLRLAE